jgi:hypothetical protein
VNLYMLKRINFKVYELATGHTPAEAAKQLERFFGWNMKVDPSELEIFGQTEADQPIYWGYYDPRTDKFVYPCPRTFKAVYGFSHPGIKEKLLDVQVGDKFDPFGEGVLDYLESVYVGPYDNISIDWDVIDQLYRKITIVANVYGPDPDEEKLEVVIFTCDMYPESWEITEIIEQRTL